MASYLWQRQLPCKLQRYNEVIYNSLSTLKQAPVQEAVPTDRTMNGCFFGGTQDLDCCSSATLSDDIIMQDADDQHFTDSMVSAYNGCMPPALLQAALTHSCDSTDSCMRDDCGTQFWAGCADNPMDDFSVLVDSVMDDDGEDGLLVNMSLDELYDWFEG